MSRFFDPTNDIAFKKLFTTYENKPLLINFLNTILKRENEETIKDVEILPTELLPDIPQLKNSLVDIRCTDNRNVQYIVEIQSRILSSFIQRVQFYGSKVYSSQLTQGDPYLSLRPVIVLSIVKQPVFPETVGYLSYHHTIETGTNQNYLKDLSFAFIELSKFNKREGELKTAADHWIHLLKDAAKEDEIPAHAPEEIKQAYHVLEQYRWNPMEKEAYDRAMMAETDAKTAIDDGWKKGIEAGKKLGVEEGKKLGVEEERKASIRKMLQEGISADIISRITGFSITEIDKMNA